MADALLLSVAWWLFGVLLALLFVRYLGEPDDAGDWLFVTCLVTGLWPLAVGFVALAYYVHVVVAIAEWNAYAAEVRARRAEFDAARAALATFVEEPAP